MRNLSLAAACGTALFGVAAGLFMLPAVHSQQAYYAGEAIPIAVFDRIGGALPPLPEGLIDVLAHGEQKSADGLILADLGIGTPAELRLLLDPYAMKPDERIEIRLRGALSGGAVVTQDDGRTAVLPAGSWAEWTWVQLPWTPPEGTNATMTLSAKPILGFVEVAAIRMRPSDGIEMEDDGADLDAAGSSSLASDEAIVSGKEMGQIDPVLTDQTRVAALDGAATDSTRLSEIPVTWFVNSKTGRDAAKGRARSATVTDGPFKTVLAALRCARDGDRIVISEGDYNEDLDVAGRDVNLVFEGAVNFN
jgi:hypothetical protein